MELLMVLVIIALFSAMMSLRIDGLFSGGDLRLASRMIIGEVKRVRGQAAHTRSDKVLAFDIEEDCFYQETGEQNRSALKKYFFPHGVHLKDVNLIPDEKIHEGTARIHFFANGCVEKTFIHLVNEEESEYTLEIRPVTGRVVIHDKYIDQE
jgi:hypothetical protein